MHFIYNKDDDLYVCKDINQIDYSDGSEDYFIDLFKRIDNITAYDLGLLTYINNWPTRYHLSYTRTNLLDSVSQLFKNRGKVLELGAGMGALTPWLAENFESVDVIEGNYKRAKALRLRTKNYNNVSVFVGDIEQSQYPDTKYDLITLIGVLEYIPFYSKNISPEDACKVFLKKVKEYLKEDGILVIAIENKLGAKYFSGCTEDHNAQLFTGIMGYPNQSPITFSREELGNILLESDFDNVQFYHAFPDYKMPDLLFREDEDVYTTSPSIFARELFPDYSGDRKFLYMDPLVVESLFKARILHHFSNSFLVLCSPQSVNLKTDWLIKKYWNKEMTKPDFHHTINFMKHRDNIFVERKPISNGVEKLELPNLRFHLKSEPFIKGDTLLLKACRYVIRNDNYGSLIELLKTLQVRLREEYSLNYFDEEGYLMVDGCCIDYCLWNIIVGHNNKFIFVDKKWNYKAPISEDLVLFRNLMGLFRIVYPFISENSLSEFIVNILKRIYPKYNLSRFEFNINIENKFQKEIRISETPISDSYVSYNQKNFLLKKENTDFLFLMEQANEFRKDILSLLKKGRIFLWGAGGHTIKLLNVLEAVKFPVNKIKAIVDSDPQKCGKSFQGIPVILKENFFKFKLSSKDNIIISSRGYEYEIYQEILSVLGDEINIIRLYDGKLKTFLFI